MTARALDRHVPEDGCLHVCGIGEDGVTANNCRRVLCDQLIPLGRVNELERTTLKPIWSLEIFLGFAASLARGMRSPAGEAIAQIPL
jgi:hypothetical protein